MSTLDLVWQHRRMLKSTLLNSTHSMEIRQRRCRPHQLQLPPLLEQNIQYLSPPEQIVQNCRGENSRTLLLWNLISAGVSPGLTHF